MKSRFSGTSLPLTTIAGNGNNRSGWHDHVYNVQADANETAWAS